MDLIYLCFPNNPTGAVATRSQLKAWVDYARSHNALILFDAAYEAFIQDPDLPHSIFEIEGARDCAIEFRSFSKNAGFTGTRCAFTVVPKGLKGTAANGELVELWGLWNRRQSTKFNGVSYIIQRGAEAVYSAAGQAEVKSLVSFYMENAAIIRQELTALGLRFTAANMPLTSGLRPLTAWIPGDSSITFSTRRMWWERREVALVLQAKAISVFPLLTAARTSMKPWQESNPCERA